MPDLLMDVLRRERERLKLSRSKLSRMTVQVGFEGVPEATIESYEVIPGRVPDVETLEALASALGIDAQAFYEYPIALARREAKKGSGDPALAVEQELRTASRGPRRRGGGSGRKRDAS